MSSSPGPDQSLADVTAGAAARADNRGGQALVCSLVPWAAFLIATVATEPWVEHRSLDWGGFAGSALGYLAFVAVPSALPLVFAPPGWMRGTVLVLMTGVAAYAGVLVVVTDDAQAGLAVLWVPYAAVPLTAVAIIGRSLRERRRLGR